MQEPPCHQGMTAAERTAGTAAHRARPVGGARSMRNGPPGGGLAASVVVEIPPESAPGKRETARCRGPSGGADSGNIRKTHSVRVTERIDHPEGKSKKGGAVVRWMCQEWWRKLASSLISNWSFSTMRRINSLNDTCPSTSWTPVRSHFSRGVRRSRVIRSRRC